MDDVVITKTFTPLIDSNGKKEVSVNVGTNISHVQSGLIKRVGYKGYCVLVVLVSYMNKEHVSFPSMTKIGELTGMSRQTVSKGIKDLEALGIIEKVNEKRFSEYKIHYTINLTNDPILIEEQKEEEAPEVVFTNAKDVAFYFAKRYEQEYGHAYMINYGRDLGLIKNKLQKTYSDDEIKTIIDVAVKEYRNKWANENYAYPTIPMLASWLSNQALTLYKEKQQKRDKLYDNIKSSEETDETDLALDVF